jgi:hypothetical protein
MLQLGLASEGIEDLASGLVTGGFYFGGAVGPLIGGAATLFFGFPWAATLMAGVFVFQSGVLAAVASFTYSNRMAPVKTPDASLC